MRCPPFDYNIACADGDVAIRFLEKYWGTIEHISLDHDFGDESYYTGYDVVKFIEEKVHVHGWEPTFTMTIHSDNPAGIANMKAGINSIFRTRS